MTTEPPKYPRIPHLGPSEAATPDDVLLPGGLLDGLLRVPVVVEEKLDGANVSAWFENGTPCVATRGGANTMDRGGQRGHVRAWVGQHFDGLRAALGEDRALYAEWLVRRHAVAYTRLPGPLVGIDVWNSAAGAFLSVGERDALLLSAGVSAPPKLFEGVLGSTATLLGLLGRSRFGDVDAEGVIIRPQTNASDLPRAIKLVDPAYRRPSNDNLSRSVKNVIA